MKKLLYFMLLLTFNVEAKLNVIATTSNLASLVAEIGGDYLEVESLCLGVQDPHFLEAKPSYIFKLSRADLLVSIGAGLEVGWLPLIIQGSRNPKIREGFPGHIIASNFVELLEQNPVDISRSEGDVHPEGNPHFMLSPYQAIKVANGITQKLVDLDNKNKKIYEKNFLNYKNKLLDHIAKWEKLREQKLKVVSYHRTLTYFYKDFGIENIDVLEPKPGIPPSASHIIGIINKMKKLKVKKIIIENYFDDTVAKRIKKEIPDIEIKIVPVAVEGKKGIRSTFDLYNYLVKEIGSI